MATNSASTAKDSKRMDYKRVSFDVTEIAPDAPAGEWGMSIPRGKCKIQPTAKDRYPMLIVPIRLDSTEEDGSQFQRALGHELGVMIVFFGEDADPRALRMSKVRLRQLCEATDVDLDIVPKDLENPEKDLEPLIRALEGKKFTGWTALNQRKDTGETVTEVRFSSPTAPISSTSDDDEDNDDEDEDRPAKGRAKPAAKKPANKRR